MIRLTVHDPPHVAGTGQVLHVGKRDFPIPEFSRVAHAQDHRVAYVLEANGDLWCFGEAGQIDIPEDIKDMVRARYFSDPESDSTK